jgi:acyl carrier protein
MDDVPVPVADPTTVPYEPPRGSIEPALAAIWAELLQRDRIGRHDNFFDLGGDSLLVMRMVNRVQEGLKIKAKVTDFFLHPVLADLARILEGADHKELTQIRRVTRRKPATSAAAMKIATGPGGGKIVSRDGGLTWQNLEPGKVVE